MSIINDALKKTQTHLQKTILPSPVLHDSPVKHVGLWIITGIIFVGLIGCSIVLFGIVFSGSTSSYYPAPSPNHQYAKANTPSPSIFLDRKGQLTLNGIMKMDNELFSLINNQIFKEGDYVDGKRIVSITNNKIEIYHKGKIVELKASR